MDDIIRFWHETHVIGLILVALAVYYVFRTVKALRLRSTWFLQIAHAVMFFGLADMRFQRIPSPLWILIFTILASLFAVQAGYDKARGYSMKDALIHMVSTIFMATHFLDLGEISGLVNTISFIFFVCVAVDEGFKFNHHPSYSPFVKNGIRAHIFMNIDMAIASLVRTTPRILTHIH